MEFIIGNVEACECDGYIAVKSLQLEITSFQVLMTLKHVWLKEAKHSGMSLLNNLALSGFGILHCPFSFFLFIF